MLDILLVDDEPLIRLSLGDAISDAGYRVTLAADGAEAASLVERRTFDVVISDIRLPKLSGLDLFGRVRSTSPGTDVILITAYGDVSDAVQALKEGAYDYLTKPFETEAITLRLARIAETRSLRQELEKARSAMRENSAKDRIIGRSPAMLRVFDRIDAFAPTDASVLITGESGTGKELVARALHEGSTRAGKPFVAVNCAAFPESLLEAELFGHERGAFTGATHRREGRFMAANGGTLFLDEVAEIPLPAQAKLLRVLQERVIEPLGSNRAQKVDVRILSATHRDLGSRISDSLFREDLYYRLNVLQLDVPPLRDRSGDLVLLVDAFLRKYCGEHPAGLTDAALVALASHSFPGNVRELEHAIQHGCVLARGNAVDVEHLPAEIARHAIGANGSMRFPTSENGAVLPLSDALKAFERQHLVRALRRTEGRRAEAAKELGISRKNLWEKLKSHGLSDEDWT